MLQDLKGCYRLLQGVTGYYRVLQGVTGWFGHKIQGVSKEVFKHQQRSFHREFKASLFCLELYVLNFVISHYQLKKPASDMECILIKRHTVTINGMY